LRSPGSCRGWVCVFMALPNSAESQPDLGHVGNYFRRKPPAPAAAIYPAPSICGFISLPLPANLPFVSDGEITLVLQRIEHGDPQASEQLLPLVYDELRRLAAARLAREHPGQTLQPTALVHEVWLRIGHNQAMWNNRAHFFAAAAEAMRRILIDNARRKRAIRHGGDLERVSTDATGLDVPDPATEEEMLIVNEALDALAAHDPRKADLVKQKYFVGLTLEEIAEVHGISHRTAKRDWAYARAWLYNEVRRLQSGGT